MKSSLHKQSLSILAKAVWFGTVALYGFLFLRGLPDYWQQLHTFTGFVLTNGFSGGWENTEAFRSALTSSNLSPGLFIGSTLLRDGMAVTFYLAVGLVIFWRRGQELIGWYTSLMLILFGLVYGSIISAPDYGELDKWISFLIGLPWLAFYAFFYIFPDGRFVPGWTRYILLIVAGFIIYASFAQLPSNTSSDNIGVLLLIPVLFGISLGAQVFRYVRVSTPLERQQTKWPLWSLIVVFAMILSIAVLIPAVLPAVRTHDPTRLIYDWGSSVLNGVSGLLLPLGLGFSILRYRLWDIDILIRRTLQYSLLTVLLALVYFGGVVLLQNIFSGITGQPNSPLIIVISTLVIAGLFNPLRLRILDFIDRRFYRKKYNAEQALAGFTVAARDEVDLHNLTNNLVRLVQETVQPDSISLWLRSDQPKRSSGTIKDRRV
jgi:hypothetical protein